MGIILGLGIIIFVYFMSRLLKSIHCLFGVLGVIAEKYNPEGFQKFLKELDSLI
jgi:polyferredoxin